MIERMASDKEECIVFFNPMSCDICFWKNHMPQELTDAFEIIFVDYPGYNNSPMVEMNSLDVLAEFIYESIVSKTTKALHLVGYSYGGLLIQHLLKKDFQNVKSISLIACANSLTKRDKEIVSVLQQVLKQDSYLFSRLLTLFSHGPTELNNNPLIPLQKFTNLKITTRDHRAVEQQLIHVLNLDQIDFKRQSIPALLIYGENDMLIDSPTIERFQELLENLQIIKLSEEWHIIEMDKIFGYITNFIKNKNHDSKKYSA